MNIRNTAILLLAGLSLWFAGCASPTQPSAMVATPTGPVTRHAQSLGIAVAGGAATSAAGASKISNEDFAEALRQSIAQSGLFATLTAPEQADYRLDVQIVRLVQPLIGFSMTVTIETDWTLTRRSDRQVAWQKAITSVYTARAGEAFAGVTRLRMATEGAARTNIQDAISRMSALVLP
jgi:hypothetical protein